VREKFDYDVRKICHLGPIPYGKSHPTQQHGKREKDDSKPIFTYYNSKGTCTLKKKSTCLLCGDGAHLGVLSVAKHSGTN
jgi:hypothetical protein